MNHREWSINPIRDQTTTTPTTKMRPGEIMCFQMVNIVCSQCHYCVELWHRYHITWTCHLTINPDKISLHKEQLDTRTQNIGAIRFHFIYFVIEMCFITFDNVLCIRFTITVRRRLLLYTDYSIWCIIPSELCDLLLLENNTTGHFRLYNWALH